MTVFEQIKKLAKSRSKTIKQVTMDLGYSQNYFYSLKSGKQPSADKLEEIADYFNVSTDYLLGRTDDEKSKSKRKQADLIAAHIDDDTSDDDLKQIIDFIDFLQNRDGK